MRSGRLAATALFMLSTSVAAQKTATDPTTGLKLNSDWELVRDNCTACHSAALITQQRGDAAHWLELIRWMQATQGLRQLTSDREKKLIAYLAKNYPPRANRRRAPIPRELMPPEPRSRK